MSVHTSNQLLRRRLRKFFFSNLLHIVLVMSVKIHCCLACLSTLTCFPPTALLRTSIVTKEQIHRRNNNFPATFHKYFHFFANHTWLDQLASLSHCFCILFSSLERFGKCQMSNWLNRWSHVHFCVGRRRSQWPRERSKHKLELGTEDES